MHASFVSKDMPNKHTTGLYSEKETLRWSASIRLQIFKDDTSLTQDLHTTLAHFYTTHTNLTGLESVPLWSHSNFEVCCALTGFEL